MKLSCPCCREELVVPENLPKYSPSLCDACGEILIVEDGKIRVPNSSERNEIREDPFISAICDHMSKVFQYRRAQRRAMNN